MLKDFNRDYLTDSIILPEDGNKSNFEILCCLLSRRWLEKSINL